MPFFDQCLSTWVISLLSSVLLLISHVPTSDSQYLQKNNEVYSMCSAATLYCYLTPSFASGQALALSGQSSAQQWCSNHFSSLVIINDPRVQNDVATFLGLVSTYDPPTIDLSYVSNWYTAGQPGGADAGGIVNWYFLNNTVPAQLNVENQQQVFFDLSYACILITSSNTQQPLTYKADTAMTKKGYICQYSDSNWFTPDSVGILYYNDYIVIYETPMLDWFSARNQCLSSGGDLATISRGTSEQLGNLTALMTGNNEYWIGLRNSWWSWMNSTGPMTDVTYSYWSGGPPTTTKLYKSYSFAGTCICVQPTGSWTLCAGSATSNYRFVCQNNTAYSTSSIPSCVTSSSSSVSLKTTDVIVISNTVSGSTTTAAAATLSGSQSNLALDTGLGTGLGGGLLVIISIIVVVAGVKKRRKNLAGRSTSSDKISLAMKTDTEHVYINGDVIISQSPVTIYPPAPLTHIPSPENDITPDHSSTPQVDPDVTMYAVVMGPQRTGQGVTEGEDEYLPNSNQPDVIYSDMSYSKQYPAQTTSSPQDMVKPAAVQVYGHVDNSDRMSVVYSEVNKQNNVI